MVVMRIYLLLCVVVWCGRHLNVKAVLPEDYGTLQLHFLTIGIDGVYTRAGMHAWLRYRNAAPACSLNRSTRTSACPVLIDDAPDEID
jgi:hypothetical protein